ncbi:UxaA family hydrolase [Fusobacterium perfoetens]|uniref:UxaA family hydrolase n=1 Tax=Fusobacterium perfoetens TaxID=852 RepID=UPI000567A97D|nr:UxaA family hydrolase [Fusobacterium perfoetens]MCI6152237.1 UxaA family hydrolase [Fusobacterium perfoetens]MDY3237491.1 UxaA family hydrolase [Fusobacterium perfoetens]
MIKGITISKNDNIIVAIEYIKKGEKIEYKTVDEKIKEIEILEDIPIYHKIALENINKGEIIKKYGEVIGIAIEEIKKGTHVHTHNIKSEKN